MIANVSKNNGVKVFALFAILAMVLAGTAVVMSDNGIDAATDAQSYGGDVGKDVKQEFAENTNVVIDKELTIYDGGEVIVKDGNLTVKEGVKVTIEDGGKLIVNGLVTINGSVTIQDNDSELQVAAIAGGETKYKDAGLIINGTLNVLKQGSIALYPEGNAGNQMGSILVNDGGNLNVTSSGSKISQINGTNVDVAVGGTFHFNGKTDSEMTVSAYGSGANQTYSVATISPTTYTAEGNSVSNLTFTVTSSNVTAYGHANKTTDVKDMTTFLVKQYMLNITGTVDGASKLTIDGVFNKEAQYTDAAYYTSEAAAKQTTQEGYLYNDLIQSKTIIDNLEVKKASAIDVREGAYVVINNSLKVTATPNSDDSTKIEGTFNVDGTLEVVGTITADYRSLVSTEKSDRDKTGTIAINGGTVTVTNGTGYEDDNRAFYISLYGAVWLNDDDDETLTYTDLESALAGASAADITEVMVCGLKMSWGDGSDTFNGRGAYLVESDITIPSGITLTVNCGLKIAENAKLTIPGDASIEFALNDDQETNPNQWSGIWVEGKLIDYDTFNDSDREQINFEVMSQVETESDIINTYTTFAIALAETTEGTIYLYDDVVIDRNMTIPQKVTVQFADEDVATTAVTGKEISFDGKYTLTVDGTLFLSTGNSIALGEGTVAVNGILKAVDAEETSGIATIKGAHFYADLNDEGDLYYVTSVAYAAENSVNIDNDDTAKNVITIVGNIAMGDVTFTAGEDVQGLTVAISNDDKDKATGNVTLDGVLFDTTDGTYDGTVSSTVTAGVTTIDLDGVKGADINFESVETAEGSTVEMQISGTSITGTVTVSSGAVSIVEATVFEKLAVSSGATVNVDANISTGINPGYKFNTTSTELPVFTEAFIGNTAGLIVDGTLVIDESAKVDAKVAHIGGTVTITEGSFYAYLSCVDGTVAVADGAGAQLAISLIKGTVTGDVIFEGVLVYPGANVDGADITSDGVTEAQYTTVYINGSEYATVYGSEDVNVEAILLFTDVNGVDVYTAKLYSDSEMKNMVVDLTTKDNATMDAIKSVATTVKTGNLTDIKNAVITAVNAGQVSLGSYSDIYIGMDPATVYGTVSVGTGLELYIDNVRYPGAKEFPLEVGTHVVSFDVEAGYDGANATITFNGQAVTNGGTIEVTDDGFTLVANGAVPSSGQPVVVGGDSDGMSLTDILLIILVVLILVMAIIVALRLMRSV